MDLVTSLPAFVLAVFLISASPGPAMALILRRAAVGGFRAAVPTVLGLEVGLYAWALIAAAGLAALVAASEAAYLLLRVVGAVVLVALGVRALREARRLRAEESSEAVDPAVAFPSGRAPRRSFGEGVVVQLANPKAAVFMMAFYPQFVPADRPMLATTAGLALLQVTLETAFYLSLAAAVSRVRGLVSGSSFRRRVETTSGAVLVALGLRVAVDAR